MWAIEGLRRLRAKGRFTESSDSIELKEELKKDMFPLSGYIEDCVNMDGNGYVVIGDAYPCLSYLGIFGTEHGNA